MNREQSDFINGKLKKDFERFVSYELKVKNFETDDSGEYINQTTAILFHMFRGGYWQRDIHIMTYGDPILKRQGIRDLDRAMEIDKL